MSIRCISNCNSDEKKEETFLPCRGARGRGLGWLPGLLCAGGGGGPRVGEISVSLLRVCECLCELVVVLPFSLEDSPPVRWSYPCLRVMVYFEYVFLSIRGKISIHFAVELLVVVIVLCFAIQLIAFVLIFRPRNSNECLMSFLYGSVRVGFDAIQISSFGVRFAFAKCVFCYSYYIPISSPFTS